MADVLAIAVYLLCAATSLACAVLLLRGYLRTRARFLLWSSLCFACLAVNNLILFVDKVVLPDVNGSGRPDIMLAKQLTTSRSSA